MKIAIISDIHDNYHNLFSALEMIEAENCNSIICLGDLGSAYVALMLTKRRLKTFCIWGNNDGDKVQIMNFAHQGNLKMSQATYAIHEVDGRKLFLTHYPDLIDTAVKSGLYDAVFFSHTHKYKEQKIGNTLISNPGELAATRTRTATFIIYDTDTNSIEKREIENANTSRTALAAKYMKNYD